MTANEPDPRRALVGAAIVESIGDGWVNPTGESLAKTVRAVLQAIDSAPVGGVLPSNPGEDAPTTEPQTLTRAIQQAVGHASMCWVGGTGDAVFDSDQALKVANDLFDWINARYKLAWE